MQIRYKGSGGSDLIVELGTDPVVIGRSNEADIVIDDKKASRQHCEVRLWGNDYAIKDMHSRNGTLVNGNTIDVVGLHDGDQIVIGSTTLFFEEKTPLGDSTALRQIEDEMDDGKGYNTILREIVEDVEEADE